MKASGDIMCLHLKLKTESEGADPGSKETGQRECRALFERLLYNTQEGRCLLSRECETESHLPTGDALGAHLHSHFSPAGTCREPSSVVTHYLPSTEAIGMHDSSVHGSVPCSSWEITSGLETWSPAQREKKESVCNKEKALDQNVISPLCF